MDGSDILSLLLVQCLGGRVLPLTSPCVVAGLQILSLTSASMSEDWCMYLCTEYVLLSLT